MPAIDRIQVRRGTAAAWTSANPILLLGEMGLETDTRKLKAGDGVTAWNSLLYISASGGGGSEWGDITGTLSDQTDLQTALDAKAPTASPTFTGTVSGITASMVGAPSGSGTSTGTNTGDQNLAPYATLASPTFTGTVTLPAGQVVNGVTLTAVGSSTNYLREDGTYGAPTASAAWGSITGTLSSQTDLNTALGLKAPLASPTFTGTVTLPAGQVVNGVTLTTAGGTSNFLRADGTYAAPTGGSPGGSNTQIQFNDSSAFGGDADFTWDKTTNTLGLNGTDTSIDLKGITTEPSAPAADTLRFYSKSIAGKMTPKIVGPSGVDTPLQNSFWQNNITMWNPTGVTAGLWIGTVGAGAGTFASPAYSSTNLYRTVRRSRYSNVVTTANQVLGQRNTEAMFTRGSVAGQGGFFFFARMGFDAWTNGGRMFVGMATANTVISGNPSSLNNTVGFCIDSGDAGAISFLTRDGSTATKQATGLTAVSGKGYDCFIFCRPNDTNIYYRIVDINTGTEYSNVATATLPVNTTMLTANVLASNAALTVANNIQIGVNKIYVETDY